MLQLPKKSNEPVPNSLSLGFIEGLYADYLRDPGSVSADWRRYFQSITNGAGPAATVRSGPSFRPASVFNPPAPAASNGAAAGIRALEMAVLQDRLDQLVRAYRVRGHMEAKIDPLGIERLHQVELDP